MEGSRLRVLVDASSASIGGGRSYLSRLIEHAHLQATAHYTILISSDVEPPGVASENVRFIRVPGSSLKRKLRVQLLARDLCRAQSVDVVYGISGSSFPFVPQPQAILIRNTLPYESIWTLHSIESRWTYVLKQRLRFWASLPFYRPRDVLVTPSRYMTDLLRRRGGGGIRTCTIPYGAQVQGKAVDEQRRKRAASDGIMLASVAGYASHKNLEVLVEASRRLKEEGVAHTLALTISREHTSEKRRYDALVARIAACGLSDHIHLGGYLDEEQAAATIASCDVYLHPSFTESFGQTLSDALAYGRPVVASDITVNREVGGDACLYFNPREAAQCAMLIKKLAGDDVLRRTLAECAQERSRHFSWEAHFCALTALFSSMAGLDTTSETAVTH